MHYGVAMISRILKQYVSFAEYSLFHKALLQKRPIILRSLLIVATHTPIGWLRLVGSLTFQVSFAECRLFYRAFLQKRHIILRSLLTKATP